MNDDQTSEMDEMDESLDIMTLVSGQVDGEDFWAYLAVRPSKYTAFLEVQKAGEPYTLTEYGNVVKYGLGTTEPPQTAVQEMIDSYGIDPQFQEKLKTDLEHQISALKLGR
tara:strand:+ start:146106 stop:146438 length:333 start_codon:yes stop_codon:yes gene_type:complete